MRFSNIFTRSEKNKAITVVALVVIILATVFVYQGILLHSRTIDQIILLEEESIDATIKGITRYSFAPYKERLSNLLTTKKFIAKTFSDRDRDKLYELTLPLYKALKRENKHLHVMHFHLPDGRTFLRMHNRQKFGDDLSKIRPAVQHVHKEKTPLTCYEVGIHGAYYRIIFPVFHQGSYVGALELGIRIHTFIDSLREKLSDPLTTFYVSEQWQKVTAPREGKFIAFGEHILNTHNELIFSQLPADLDLSVDNQRLTIAGKNYLLHAYPVIHDFQGKLIGGFIVLQDITQALANKKAFVFKTIIFACLLFTIALIFLNFSFSRLIGKLERSRSNLKNTVNKLALEVEERKQTEKQLYKSKENWERTFDSFSDLVTIMNSKLQIIKANQATYKMFNVEPGSLNGRFCYEIYGKRTSACEGCPAVDTIDNYRESSSEIFHQNLGKSFLVSTSPIPDEKGEYSNIIHIARDITEKKSLESQLQQAQKMEAIGTLAGGIAHDFNNILTAISGYTELVILKAGDNEGIANYLKRIKEATERATNLVTQILTFSRKTDHAKRPLQISFIVKEALKLLRSSIPTSIEIKQDINCQATILADPTQVHQIIMNLATNAYQAMLETGGIMGVALKEIIIGEQDKISEFEIAPGSYLRLEVSDTGYGMDAKTKEKIFDPYFTTKEFNKGTGLGLSVVHGIVESHHGHIHVYSEPGQGTTFHVYLPIIEAEADNHAPQVIEEPARGGSERIMIIDDEQDIIDLAEETLTMYGYKITTFSDGVKAMQDFEKHPDDYELVITDMAMPNMTGLDITHKIKGIRPNLPIILCSGYSEIINKEKSLALGISRYIQKPLIMDSLARVIRELLDNNTS